MIRALEPGRAIRRTVVVEGTEYVLELTAGGVSMRRRRARTPWAILPLGALLELGRNSVLRELSRKRHRRAARRRPKTRRRK